MSTHINAFYAEVSEKEAKVAEAQAELEGAKRRLTDKEVEQGLPVTYSDPVVEPEQSDEDSLGKKGKKS